MAGRPKKDDSRDKQYRVRLNDREEEMLNYVTHATGLQKSEILRHALIDFYNKVRVNETASDELSYEEIWGDDSISLLRVVNCPYCSSANRVDFSDFYSMSVDEDRQMGTETTYEFDLDEYTCCSCGRIFQIKGYISEYPPGAFNSEKINAFKSDEK